MRRHRGGASVAELALATGLGRAQLARILDELLETRLAVSIPARSDRPLRYGASCNQIAIRADSFNKAHSLAIRSHFRDATSDVLVALRDADEFDGSVPEGQYRIDARLKLELDDNQWPEFVRRIRSAIDYAMSAMERNGRNRNPTPSTSQHALCTELAPCRARLLPAPPIRVVNPRHHTTDAPVGPQAVLSEREWQVAEMFASRLTKKTIAARLRVTPNTVATLLRRAYRKLGVTGRAELGQRLERVRRHG